MEKTKESGRGMLVVAVTIFVVIIGAVAWLLYSVFSPKETRTSTTKTEGEMGVLECKSSAPREGLFSTPNGEVTGTHKIKVMMRDEKASEVAYEYSGTFESEAAATSASSKMHADYNIYTGAEGDKLSPVFGAVDTTARISLYAKGGGLNSANAKVFHLTTDEMLEFYNLSRANIEKIYKGKGFSCNYSK